MSLSLCLRLGSAVTANPPVYTPPSDGMVLGCNMAWINSYSARVFSNLMLQASTIEQRSGTGAYTVNRGDLTATVSTDKFSWKLADDSSKLPSLNMTILNPNGCLIKLGDFNVPSSGFTTATQFTATVIVGQGVCALWSQGSMSGVKVIYTDHLAQYLAGNIWHNDFMNFHTQLGEDVMRTMDMSLVNLSTETDWADRTLPSSTTFGSPFTSSACCVPWEVLCDLANRLDKDLWLCVPPRATQDYRDKLAALIQATLSPRLRVWPETGNEIWNFAAPWASGSNWIAYYTFTKYTATANFAGNSYTSPAHGLTNAQAVAAWDSAANHAVPGLPAIDFRIIYGGTVYAKVLDVDTFQLYAEVGLTTLLTVRAAQANVIYCKVNEAGKTYALDAQYGAMALRNWNAFAAVRSPQKIVNVLATQFVDTSKTVNRLAVSGVSSAVKYVAGAPYFAGFAWAIAGAVSTGAIVPAMWANQSCTAKVSIWANGSTPTDAQLASGTGTGVVAGSLQTQTYTFSSFATTYTSAASVGSLVNGTPYDVWYLITDNKGRNWRLKVTVTPSVTASTSYTFDTYDNQLLRDNLNSFDSIVTTTAQIAAIGGVAKFICYEGGGGYDGSVPANWKAWYDAYQLTSQFGEAIRHNLYCLSASGSVEFNYYGDLLGSTRQLANSSTSLSEPRFQAYAAFGGFVPKRTILSVANQSPANILASPGALPYTVVTLPSGLTYTIISGDVNRNYQITGNLFQMVNETGIDYAVPLNLTIRVLADDGFMPWEFTIQFATGDAWYQNDATFAWSSIVDTDNVAMNPTIGSVLPRTAGSGATVTGDLWDMDSNAYYNATGLNATILNSQSFLVACVMDRDNHSAAFNYVLNLGGGDFFNFYTAGSVTTSFELRYFSNTFWDIGLHFVTSGTVPTGKHVFWAFWDITTKILTVGIDQTVGQTSTTDISAKTISRNLSVGGSTGSASSLMKYGSMQVVNRAGMTLVQGMAAVAKMQTYHSIP